jgi:hypothetical protein
VHSTVEMPGSRSSPTHTWTRVVRSKRAPCMRCGHTSYVSAKLDPDACRDPIACQIDSDEHSARAESTGRVWAVLWSLHAIRCRVLGSPNVACFSHPTERHILCTARPARKDATRRVIQGSLCRLQLCGVEPLTPYVALFPHLLNQQRGFTLSTSEIRRCCAHTSRRPVSFGPYCACLLQPANRRLASAWLPLASLSAGHETQGRKRHQDLQPGRATGQCSCAGAP